MNFLNLLIWILFLILLPISSIVIILYFMSKKFQLAFSYTGLFEISDISFCYENDTIKIRAYIGRLNLKFVWFKLKIMISEIKTDIEINDEFLLNNKQLSNDNKQDAIIASDQEPLSVLTQIKNKFHKIIIDKYLIKENQQNNKSIENNELIVLKTDKPTLIDKIVKQALNMLDISVEHLSVLFKMNTNPFYHSIFIKKIIICSNKEYSKVKFLI